MGIKGTLQSRIPTYRRAVRGALANAVKDTALEVEVRAQRNAPVDEGNLKNGIGAKPTGDPLAWTVDVGADYGADVEFGTGPHIIRPRKGKFLRFVVNGKVVFARIVRHPGTAANPYLRPAVSSARPGFERRIADAIKGAK